MFFRYGSSNIPHYQKQHKGGEDAWIAQEDLLVVADGVGGWEKHGIDSGKFSKQLVHNIKRVFEHDKRQDLKGVLMESVRQNNFIGSSTAVLATLNDKSQLLTTNLGDSGYMIYRPDYGRPQSLTA